MDKTLNTKNKEEQQKLVDMNTVNVDNVDGSNIRIPNANEDDENAVRPTSVGGHPGIYNGFINTIENGNAHHMLRNGTKPRRSSFGYLSEEPIFVEIDGVQTPVPDVNAYQHKKTLAQGMMDLALLSANANQLRYVLETYRTHPYFYPSLICILISIIFQIAVGAGLILNSRYNIKNKKDICRANRINNYTIIGVFIVTVVNVFISAFGVADPADTE